MAKQGPKTDMIGCVVEVDQITFQYKVKQGEEWQVVEELKLDCNAVPDQLVDGDGFASMRAYGIRAFISDRTSQLRSDSIPKTETMAAMREVYEMLCQGLYRTKRSAGKKTSDLDLLAQAVADLKGLALEVATATVKALSKEKLDALRSNKQVADRVLELRKAVAAAEAVDLDDLLGDL